MSRKILLAFLLIILLIFLGGCIQIKSSVKADGGVFKSVDKGESWTQRVLIPSITKDKPTIGLVNVHRMVFDPQDNNTIYLGSKEDGLFYTYNGAQSWWKASSLGVSGVSAIAVDPSSKCIIYVASANKVFNSTDCSRTWENIYLDSRGGVAVTALAVDAYDSSIIYAGNSKGELLRSKDYGSSWANIYQFNNKIEKILIADDTRIMYLATQGKGIFKTEDKGESWQEVNEGLSKFKGALNFIDLVFDKSKTASLVLISRYGLVKTEDGGETWQPIELLTPPGGVTIRSMALNPKRSEEIYYTTASTFYKSLDGGKNWITKKLPTPRLPTQLLVDPLDPEIIYMGLIKIEK